MRIWNFLIPLFIFFSFSPLKGQELICDIQLNGNEKTRAAFLNAFIHSKVKEPYDSVKAELDVQRLRNLNLFFDAQLEVRDSSCGKILLFKILETKTIVPIVNFGVIRENFWFRLGAKDFNLSGKGQRLSAWYQYFDRHSFFLLYENPFANQTMWGYQVDLQKLSRIEPIYSDSQQVNYNYDNLNATLAGQYSFSLQHQIRFGYTILHETYERIGSPIADFNIPEKFSLAKSLVKTQWMWGNLDYYYHYLNGFENQLTLEGVATHGGPDWFWKILNISRYFHKVSERSLIATRLRLGISSNKDSPFAPFVLDSYVNIRGVGNQVARGTAEFTLNTEYRHTFLQNNWLAMEALAFADIGGWRPPSASLSTTFKKANMSLFVGPGVRFHTRKYYRLTLRLDYGVSLMNAEMRGIVIGLDQYF